MKRILKLLFNLALALLATLVTLLVIFFLTPAWQKRFLEEALAGDPQRQFQVGSVRILPFGTELEDLYLIEGPMGAGVEFLEASGPLWKLPFLGLLEIDSGTVLGLEMDLTRIRVGDLTSEDYQAFLERVADDPGFWQERLGLVLSKAAARGIRVRIRNTTFSGKLLMPGNHLVPVRWTIVEADSEAPRLIRMERHREPEKML